MDNNQILSIFLKGALGSRGRKRARRATRFLTGNKGFLTASTVVGAAGVAWGIIETLQNSQNAQHGPASGAGAPPTAGNASAATLPPPIPGAAAASSSGGDEHVFPTEVLRVVRLAVSAARADGTLLPAERALILSHAREAGVESVVELELATPRPLSEIVGGIADEQQRRDLYVLAYAIVRADDSVSGAERVYLAQLAYQLGIDAAMVARLESETAARIDAEPDAHER